MTDLAATQRWIQDVITDPDGVPAALDRVGGATGTLTAERVVHGSASLAAGERLALYGRTYQRRLVGCLRDGYPALRHALGEELFDDFAVDYLRAQPPRSYTLASLGAGWPEHLEATRPDGDLPAHERELWPDFLVDLASLERTFCEVYDGPGIEGLEIATAADVPDNAMPDAIWSQASVTPVGCLRLVRARFAVGDYLVAVRRGEDPPLPGPARCLLAVSRRDYVVTIAQLDAAAHALLSQLCAGARIGAAATSAGVTPEYAWRLVRAWVDRGLVGSIDAPGTSAVQSTGER